MINFEKFMSISQQLDKYQIILYIYIAENPNCLLEQIIKNVETFVSADLSYLKDKGFVEETVENTIEYRYKIL